MNYMEKLIAVLGAFFFLGGVVYATEHGTPKEAQALTQKAIAYYKEVGKDAAFAEFNNKQGKFTVKDLYVVVYGLDEKMYVHPFMTPAIKKSLSGKIAEKATDFKDADGKLFIKEMLDKVKSHGKGWIDYRFANPDTKKIAAKSAYFEKVDNFVFSVGAWKYFSELQ